MAEGTIFKTGDLVTMRYGEDRSMPASIRLASSNGVSIMLEFEAIVGGHVGMMPVSREEDGYRSIVTGLLVQLEARHGR